MRALVRYRKVLFPVEHDEGELRQVNLVNLPENLLPHARIRRRLFLSKQIVQGTITVEVDIEAGRENLVAGEQVGVIRVVVQAVLKLGNVIPVRHRSRRRGGLSLG